MANIVGVTGSVTSNPYNKLAQELEEKEQKLTEREKQITSLEASLKREVAKGPNQVIVFGFIVSSLLFTMMGINFYLDWKRNKLKTKI